MFSFHKIPRLTATTPTPKSRGHHSQLHQAAPHRQWGRGDQEGPAEKGASKYSTQGGDKAGGVGGQRAKVPDTYMLPLVAFSALLSGVPIFTLQKMDKVSEEGAR